MASTTEVRTYLAHWFQLGKKLVWRNGKAELLPHKIIQGDNFTAEFEECWAKIMSVDGQDCYFLGEEATIQELLTPAWTIDQCARCTMPVATVAAGIQPLDCACSDLDNWPNTELPAPRLPISSQGKLKDISARLQTQEKAKSQPKR